ncbi:MAG: sugar ABC transporter permease [Spirochaetaceae bacterium]|jgi:raffinose/stachyose/melibiose transport system permease protein|nr:sugar ABC transporter permease [Spirochaetaceae bacterium]
MEKFYKKISYYLSLPAVILFVLVIFVPFVMGILYSFTAWRGAYFVGGDMWHAFNGLTNYKKVFASTRFFEAFWYTIRFTVLAVVFIAIVGLALAMLTTSISKMSGLFRTMFFMPNLLGGLALGYIWKFIFEIIFSSNLFGPEGLIPIPALTYMTQNNIKAIFALMMLTSWQWAGYMMLIYVNGLITIPKDLYESAEIDGANAVQRFRHITLPMLMPSFTIVLFLLLGNCFKLLDQNVALTDGDFSTRLLALQILRTIRDSAPPDYGFAQAQAVVFFIMVAVVSLLQVRFTKSREVEA